MRAEASLLFTFEDIVNRCPLSRRAELLDRITDLYLVRATSFGEQHIRLFDEIFIHLIAQIETAARFKLSVSLAGVVNAPPQIIRRLAHDDDVYVAGPVLQNSESLVEADLIDLAKRKSQRHLLVISGRSHITEPVTDVLVRRGDREVLRRIAGNLGAMISESAFASLVMKAGKDGILAETVGQRRDIPEPLFRALLMEATTVVQKRLFAKPEIRKRTQRMLDEFSKELESKSQLDQVAAEREINKVGRDVKLDKSTLIELAEKGDYEVTIAALASRCGIPISIVNRVAANKDKDPALILCKGVGLGWSTACAVILSRTKRDGVAPLTLENKRRAFEKMSIESAQDVLRHWKTLYKVHAKTGRTNVTN